MTKIVQHFYTLITSSAMAERVFSALKRFFTVGQMRSSLSDITSASLMLTYNRDFIMANPNWEAHYDAAEVAALC